MRLFQFVEDRIAEVVLKDGFEDLPFHELTEDGHVVKGVWLFNSPDGWQEKVAGADGDGGKVMLAVEIPDDALSGHEILMMDDELEIREFLVPAYLVNSFGRPKIADVEFNWPGLLEDIYTDDIGEDPE